ncbi:RNA methyltransferase [Pelotomaculum isophthalicicum JI]|uniref:RNA methyltransferase n=1 Tax=Pelotomaculum isophthalicicum JI TaxID=947010 RepID=A0A9X4GY46_9FIRM|nr:RNA methyltransferase [Pelotomaculum isophthalicicum]MDF9407417.1 RNA methyltransferase [Pelotomaculum isophthalicicum JI]
MISRQNPRIKYLRRLATRRFRDLEGKFLVEGTRFVEEALESSFSVEMLVYCEKAMCNARGQALLEAASVRGISVLEVEESLFEELADTVTPQGILAVVKWRWYKLNDLHAGVRPWLLVLVDGVADPGNLGTIVRSADAAGADGVILLKGTADIFNPKALRATMGSIFHIPVIRNSAFDEVETFFNRHGIKLVAGMPHGGKVIFESNLTESCALVVGSEPRGPGGNVMSAVFERVHIPMPGRAESLNVAISTAILLYEAVRQRNSVNS